MNYLKLKPLFDGSSKDCTISSLQTLTKTFIYKANKIGKSLYLRSILFHNESESKSRELPQACNTSIKYPTELKLPALIPSTLTV